MSSHESRRSRLSSSLLALAAVTALTAALAAPAGAVKGQGNAVIIAAQHDQGRTLSGQGVKLGLTGGSVEGNKLTVPIAEVSPAGPKPTVQSGAILSFSKNKKAANFADLRFNLSAGTLEGKYMGGEVPIFRVEGAPQVNSVSGAVSLSAARLRLIGAAADTIQGDLDLPRALNRKGVGMVWLSAQANPTQVKHNVTSGALDWGFLTSWRSYVLSAAMGPGSAGTITTGEGATANGTLSAPGAYFGFPATSGTFDQGFYGASSTLALNTTGSVTFAKPITCIHEITFSQLRVIINGANSSIVGNLKYDIDKVEGKTCGEDLPPVTVNGTTIATLNASGVTPTFSPNGKTVTWANVPATLTAAAAVPFSPIYQAGKELDPVSITVGVG